MTPTHAINRLPLTERIERNIMRLTESGCWIWMLKITKTGYGFISIDGRCVLVHRAAYRAWIGEIPSGLLVCHRCDVRYCANPDHLFLGTHMDNLEDMHRKGRNADLRGSNNGGATFTDAEIIDIRTSPETTAQVATRYSRSFQTIWAIRKNKSWRHIHAPILVGADT